MVASQSWQGRQSLQVRPRASLQIAATALRPSRIQSTSGRKILSAALCRKLLFETFGSLQLLSPTGYAAIKNLLLDAFWTEVQARDAEDSSLLSFLLKD